MKALIKPLFLTLLMCCSSLLYMHCGSDDDTNLSKNVNASIVGTWSKTRNMETLVLTIKDDGTATLSVDAEVILNITYTLFEDDITVEDSACGNGVLGVYQFLVFNNQLTFAFIEDPCQARVLTLPGVWDKV